MQTRMLQSHLDDHLDDMLREIKDLYGERDAKWNIFGIDFFSKDGPHIVYPYDYPDNILIRLTPDVQKEEEKARACFQLAHETVHLLSPTGPGHGSAKILEEGLGTIYSKQYVSRHFGYTMQTGDPRYDEAASFVQDLLNAYPSAIKNLRSFEPCFSKMTTDTFLSAGIEYPQEKINVLLKPFGG